MYCRVVDPEIIYLIFLSRTFHIVLPCVPGHDVCTDIFTFSDTGWLMSFPLLCRSIFSETKHAIKNVTSHIKQLFQIFLSIGEGFYMLLP